MSASSLTQVFSPADARELAARAAQHTPVIVSEPWMGRIHIEVLGIMVRNHGRWPGGLKPYIHQARVLNTLCRKGIVAEADGVYRLVAA